jgi:hypothetical protein
MNQKLSKNHSTLGYSIDLPMEVKHNTYPNMAPHNDQYPGAKVTKPNIYCQILALHD